MSETLRKTAAGYKAQLAQLERQITNLTKRRDDLKAAASAIEPLVAKLPAPVAKPAPTKSVTV